MKATHRRPIRYREWEGTTADLVNVATKLQESLDRSRDGAVQELHSSERYREAETKLAELGEGDTPMHDLYRDRLSSMGEELQDSFKITCTAQTQAGSEYSDEAAEVLSRVRVEDITECALAGPSPRLFAEPRGQVSLRFARQRFGRGVIGSVSGTDEAWVLATEAAAKMQLDVGGKPWWRFMRRTWFFLFAILVGWALSIGISGSSDLSGE